MSNTEQNDGAVVRPRSRIYGTEPADAVVQRGDHGEGAETIGNSVRGALSGGSVRSHDDPGWPARNT